MFRKFLKAKIHSAVVSDANLAYEGSITIPPYLMALTGIAEFEAVNVWNVTNGSRFETYAIKGSDDTTIIVNGAAAHLTKPGDKIIIGCFTFLPESAVPSHKPRIVIVDDNNRPKNLEADYLHQDVIDLRYA